MMFYLLAMGALILVGVIWQEIRHRALLVAVVRGGYTPLRRDPPRKPRKPRNIGPQRHPRVAVPPRGHLDSTPLFETPAPDDR